MLRTHVERSPRYHTSLNEHLQVYVAAKVALGPRLASLFPIQLLLPGMIPHLFVNIDKKVSASHPCIERSPRYHTSLNEHLQVYVAAKVALGPRLASLFPIQLLLPGMMAPQNVALSTSFCQHTQEGKCFAPM